MWDRVLIVFVILIGVWDGVVVFVKIKYIDFFDDSFY